MVTITDVRDACRRLSVVFGTPLAAKRDRESFEAEWHRTLRNLSGNELERAVSAYLDSKAERWPTPGILLHAARDRPDSRLTVNEQTYLNWERTWGRNDMDDQATFTGCPACGAFPGWDNGRLRVTHHSADHRRQRLPIVGWSDECEAMYAPTRPEVRQ